jgi:hypothetical protein
MQIMSMAKVAGTYIAAHVRVTFAEKLNENGKHESSDYMAGYILGGSMIDVFDHTGHMTHKYFESDRMTAELGEPEGGGVYAAYGMQDGSLLLLTCKGPLAYWSGQTGDKAEWITLPDVANR